MIKHDLCAVLIPFVPVQPSVYTCFQTFFSVSGLISMSLQLSPLLCLVQHLAPFILHAFYPVHILP